MAAGGLTGKMNLAKRLAAEGRQLPLNFSQAIATAAITTMATTPPKMMNYFPD